MVYYNHILMYHSRVVSFNPIRAFFGVSWRGGGGGGWGEVPVTDNSKTINGIEMKFSRAVENHKLINLVLFNW